MSSYPFKEIPTEFKRSPHLIMYFEGNKIVFDNYFSRERFASDDVACRILMLLNSWNSVSEIKKHFRSYKKKSFSDAIRKLMRAGLVISKDSDELQAERKMNSKSRWPIASRFYHFSTKTTEFLITPQSSRAYYDRYLKNHKEPPIYKLTSIVEEIKLPRKLDFQSVPFHEVLLRRKSIRSLSGEAISIDDLSKILHYTWGKVSYYKTGDFGLLMHKTSPSAGARHPTEVYAIVNNVEGIERGLYHYSVKHHSLELMKKGDYRQKCVTYCAGQSWPEMSSALFIMTSVVERTTWKYRVPRTYRSLLLDVGHLSQTFFLVCTAMGLGPFCTGVMCDTLIEKELGIDGIEETIVFVVGVGKPKEERKIEVPVEVQ